MSKFKHPDSACRGRMVQIKKASEVAKYLLQLEAFGVLDRHIVSHPIITDEEHFGRYDLRVVPPRLYFNNIDGTLFHCYGNDTFYEENPEYVRGGLSYECIIVERMPMHLANYTAMEGAYSALGLVDDRNNDPLHMVHRRYVSPEELARREREQARKLKAKEKAREYRERAKEKAKAEAQRKPRLHRVV